MATYSKNNILMENCVYFGPQNKIQYVSFDKMHQRKCKKRKVVKLLKKL